MSQVKSSQIYLYSAFHNTDCIKAASQYQSRQLNSVCLFMKTTIKFGRADQWYDGSFNPQLSKPKSTMSPLAK